VRCDLIRQPLPAIAALSAVLGLSACGSAGPAGVSVDALQTNVIFGAEQSQAARPAAVFPTTPVPPPPAGGISVPPTLVLPAEFGFNALPFFIAGACPVAPENGFPAQPATSDVTLLPANGQYRWAASGTYDLPVGTTTLQLPVPTYFQEFVRRVQPFPENFPSATGGQQGVDFTYDTVEPATHSAGYLQFVWQVKSNAPIGDPEAGLSLVEIDTISSPGGAATPIFKAAPHNGLLLLPLPAAPGPVQPPIVSTVPAPPLPALPLPTSTPRASSTESVDTSGSGNNLQFSGSVGAPERLDACGTWLQAWPVDGTLVNGSSTATIHLDVATQTGALVIALDIDGGFLGTTFHKLATHVGQALPSTLPAQWQ
jgi:hypothetical protein